VAGGIGITPLRALLEALPARPGDLTLLYRVGDPHEIVFRGELEALARARGANIQYLMGHRGHGVGDSLDAPSIARFVPDVRDRDVFLCGPVSMMQRVETSLEAIGVPRSQVHAERFAY
jgi:ferredoxin-NADP reductase